jgi:hypothetical protein
VIAVAVNKYNTNPDIVDQFIDHTKRLKTLERNVSGMAIATSYLTDQQPWPNEGPNGDHAAAVGVIWFNPDDSSASRWSAEGSWDVVATWPRQRSFWYLDTALSIASGANGDISTWVDDGDTNSYLITMDQQQNVTVAKAVLYRISVGITYPVNATCRRYVQVFTGASGGTVIVGDWRGTSSTGVVTPQVSRTVRLNAGDIFRVTAFQDSGVSLSLLAGNQFSYLQVTYEGAN